MGGPDNCSVSPILNHLQRIYQYMVLHCKILPAKNGISTQHLSSYQLVNNFSCQLYHFVLVDANAWQISWHMVSLEFQNTRCAAPTHLWLHACGHHTHCHSQPLCHQEAVGVLLFARKLQIQLDIISYNVGKPCHL